MKIYQIIILTCMCMLQNIVHAQTNKIHATYVYDLSKYLAISGDGFRLYARSPIFALYGLNKGDSILAEGKVQYESGNFIKLTSKDYEWEAKKSMTVTESTDSHLNDSIRFNFIFPFDGTYKIILHFGNDYKNQFEFKDKKEFIIPANKDSLTFSFMILNQTVVDVFYLNYLKPIKFSSTQNTVRNSNSNSFEISIPDLTNSYFNRFLINGEYIRVSKEKDALFWRNEKYEKSNHLK